MPDSFLIITPLLVLAVVLLLGYGCPFSSGTPQPPSLFLRARVPTGLTVQQGVSFRWIRPTGTQEVEPMTEPAPDGQDNVYEHEVPSPEAGIWHVTCEMVVEDGGNQEPGFSPVCEFGLEAGSGTWVYLFQAKGIPLVDFQIECKGLHAQ